MIDTIYKKRFLLLTLCIMSVYIYVIYFATQRNNMKSNTTDELSLQNLVTEIVTQNNNKDKNKMLDILSSIVKIDNTSGTASGVMIYQDKPMVYVLSVSHILEKDRSKNNLFVHMFENNNQVIRKYKADIVCYDRYYDISLLVFEYGQKDVQSCRVLNTDNININTLDNVISAGCLIGNRPSLSTGFVTGRMRAFGIPDMMLSNAPVAPGASGGGVFKFYDGEYFLIGTTVAMGGYGNILFEHVGLSLPSCYVYEWIVENQLEDLLGYE